MADWGPDNWQQGNEFLILRMEFPGTRLKGTQVSCLVRFADSMQ